MRKVVKGAVVITMAAGLSLWNTETQEAVELPSVTCNDELPGSAAIWEESLSVGNEAEEEVLADDMAAETDTQNMTAADTGDTTAAAATTDTITTGMALEGVDTDREALEVSKAISDKVIYLEEARKVRVKEHKLELKRARQEKRRQERLAQIQKCCGVRVSEKDRAILERIVEAEAGDQDHTGKLLVANVILNRVKSKTFPSTIQGVVFAPRQFSPISNGRYFRVSVSADTKKAVDDALNGIDGSQGALYFMDRRYSSSSNVVWFDTCLTRLFQHQGHEFYK